MTKINKNGLLCIGWMVVWGSNCASNDRLMTTLFHKRTNGLCTQQKLLWSIRIVNYFLGGTYTNTKCSIQRWYRWSTVFEWHDKLPLLDNPKVLPTIIRQLICTRSHLLHLWEKKIISDWKNKTQRLWLLWSYKQ